MRVVLHAIAVVMGAAVAVSVVAVHRSVVLDLPLGMLLGLATTFASIWALRQIQPQLVTSFAAGWVGAFGVTILGKAEGDYAVASDTRGYLLIGAALAVLVVGLASLSSRRSSSGVGAT